MRALWATALLAVSMSPSPAQQRTLRVGSVLDGAADPNAELGASVRGELARLLGGGYDLQFPADRPLVGD